MSYRTNKRYTGSQWQGAYRAAQTAIAYAPQIRQAYKTYKKTFGHKAAKPAMRARARRAPAYSSSSSSSSTSHQGGGVPQPLAAFKFGRPVKTNQKFVKKVREATSSINKYNSTTNAQITAAIGQCKFAITHVLGSSGDYETISNKILATSPIGNTNKFMIRDQSMGYNITNMSSGQQYLKCYMCIPRTDIPAALTTSGLLSQGWTDAGYSGGPTDLSSTVFSSPSFVTWFKVLSVKVYEFAPGQSKLITINDRSPHLINMERVNGTNLTRGKSKFIVFQAWGQVVDDSTNNTLVSTDASKFSIVSIARYSYQFIQDFTTNVYSDVSLGAVAQAQYIQPETGATVNDAEA